ncbi:type VI secretion protein [Limoniibacter endophyticus]|uniref:Type VI secretion protein n=1 Tax=Limoniibacter endophyticus TaxID=1565040 RepID=A0A8J3DHZ1_9HYPH|nr:type VI secretion protein [Limoniibacter endophyticus]
MLAWLMEAQLRISGFSGLRNTYSESAQLISDYGHSLHSVDEAAEERFQPFAGLNGEGGEGTLIQPLRLTSLIPNGNFAQFSLWDFQLAQREGQEKRREELLEAANDAGREAMAARLREVIGCLEAFDAFVTAVNAQAGSQAPSSSNIRNTLQEIAVAIRAIGGFAEIEDAAADQASTALAESSASVAKAVRSISGEIQSREQAFEMLAAIAGYFRRYEPHSPVALSIETLVRRGRMDFAELLTELLPEMHTRNAVLTAAGIQPKPETE